MDQNSHAQIRLILGDASIRTKKALNDRVFAIYGRAFGGPTDEDLKVAIGTLEEIASKFITSCVDQVAPIAKDAEAFGMIEEAFFRLMWFLREHIARGAMNVGYKKAAAVFNDSKKNLRRQLEIQRFNFTVPQQPLSTVPTPVPPAKSRAGKPLAAHWDEIWAEIIGVEMPTDLKERLLSMHHKLSATIDKKGVSDRIHTSSHGAKAESIRRAIEAVFPQGIPSTLGAKERNKRLTKWLQAHDLPVPSARTFQRVIGKI